MVVSFFIPEFRRRHHVKTILIDGIFKNKQTILIENISNADWIILSDPKHFCNSYKIYENKIIIVDYEDKTNIFDFPHKFYFKRSVVDKSKLEFIKYKIKIYHISLCLINIPENILKLDFIKKERDYDISVFFSKDNLSLNNRHRTKIAKLIDYKFSNYKVFVGIKGNSGKKGRNNLQYEYFSQMVNSKIVVTCNPDLWEGDYRTYEALYSGALVFVDKMITPKINKFENNIHLIYYDKEDLTTLLNSIEYYIKNTNERLKIAKSGKLFVENYHTNKIRIGEIIDIINR